MKFFVKFVTFLAVLALSMMIMGTFFPNGILSNVIDILFKSESYLLIYLFVVSIASASLKYNKSATASDIAIIAATVILGIVLFSNSMGANIIPEGASLLKSIKPFVDFIAGYKTLLDFVLSFAIVGCLFMSFYVYTNYVDANNRISKKLRALSKFSLYLTLIVLFVCIVLNLSNLYSANNIAYKILLISVGVLVYSTLLIGICDYAFSIEELALPEQLALGDFVMNGNLGVPPINNPSVISNVAPNTSFNINQYEVPKKEEAISSGVKIFTEPPKVENNNQNNVLSPSTAPIIEDKIFPMASAPIMRDDNSNNNQ